MMRKLVGFSLKYDNLKLSVELKPHTDSVWVCNTVDLSNPFLICRLPKSPEATPAFEQQIEEEMAFLAIESRKLTNQKGEE